MTSRRLLLELIVFRPSPHDQIYNLIICYPLFLTRTQFKKFLGKSVKKAKHLAEEYGEKAVNKVKSVRDEGKRKQ